MQIFDENIEIHSQSVQFYSEEEIESITGNLKYLCMSSERFHFFISMKNCILVQKMEIIVEDKDFIRNAIVDFEDDHLMALNKNHIFSFKTLDDVEVQQVAIKNFYVDAGTEILKNRKDKYNQSDIDKKIKSIYNTCGWKLI